MSIRIIQAYVTGTGSDRSVLDAALAVARRFRAHIDVIHPRPSPGDAALAILDSAYQGFGNMVDAIERSTAERAARVKAEFEKWRTQAQLPVIETPQRTESASTCWREAVGADEVVVTAHGRLADLLVIARADPSGEGPTVAAVEAALFGTGRPVLIVPPGGPADPFGAAVIAWNGSLEATRAVAGALPLLEASDSVSVFTAAAEGDRQPEATITDHLAWHGVRTTVASFSGPDVGAMLIRHVTEQDARLLVMGAYTHGRLRQTVLGGVTRHLLSQAPCPVLMTH